MREITYSQTCEVHGASHIKDAVVSDRNLQEFAVSTLAGAVSGGSWWVMGGTVLAFKAYYNFQSGVKAGPSGPATNHLTTSQYRAMQ